MREARCPISSNVGIGHSYDNDSGRYLYSSLRICSVKTGKPIWNDPMEPIRAAEAVKNELETCGCDIR